jgi:hypothetical protein
VRVSLVGELELDCSSVNLLQDFADEASSLCSLDQRNLFGLCARFARFSLCVGLLAGVTRYSQPDRKVANVELGLNTPSPEGELNDSW